MSDSNLVKAFGDLFEFSGSGRARGRHHSSMSNCKGPVKSCIPGVMKKLRRHPEYQDTASENELKEVADQLVNPDKIMDHFFSDLTHHVVHAGIKEKEDEDPETMHNSKMKRARSANRVEEAAKFQVKLLLRYVDRSIPPPKAIGKLASAIQMEYGPLHAILLINNELLLEWNSSSLILPKYTDPGMHEAATGPLLVSATVQNHVHIQRQLSKPFEAYDEIDLIFDATSKKMELLRNLANVIALYNSQFYYDVVFRNCQNFVLDALTAIGCKNKPEFGGNLKAYFTHLKKEGHVKVDFETHKELDDFVKKNHAGLSPENMEYLLAQYFVFHLQNGNHRGGLSCRLMTCMMEFLEAKIDHKLMIMNKYLVKPLD